MPRYQPQFQSHAGDTDAPHPLGKIVCVGRNYAAHARELNNPVPEEPLLFMKPATAACALDQPLTIPADRGAVHFETELALWLRHGLTGATEDQALAAVGGVGLALDLTLRDLQAELKAKGHPWEIAKGFDGACPLSAFRGVDGLSASDQFEFTATIDHKVRQRGDTTDMLQPIGRLLSYMSAQFTLEPGDVILTGTPQGVGPLHRGQTLALQLGDDPAVHTQVR